jgi:hypothetical protein
MAPSLPTESSWSFATTTIGRMLHIHWLIAKWNAPTAWFYKALSPGSSTDWTSMAGNGFRSWHQSFVASGPLQAEPQDSRRFS